MSKRLNEKQLAAIAILALPKRGGMTYEEVAENVGVTVRTLYDWRQTDEFNVAIQNQILRNTVDRLPDIFDAVPEHIIENGNAAMFRTLLQALGLLTNKVEINDTREESTHDIDAMKAEIERFKAHKSENTK